MVWTNRDHGPYCKISCPALSKSVMGQTVVGATSGVTPRYVPPTSPLTTNVPARQDIGP